jgi:hypothetical protein
VTKNKDEKDMERLSCEDVEKALVALTLNPRELSEAERANILAQVDGCEGCRELYEDYVRIRAGLLQAVPARVPPSALKASLMARVQQSAAPAVATPVAAPQPIQPPVSRPAPARNPPIQPETRPEKQPGLLQGLWDWLTGSARVPRMAFGFGAAAIALAAGLVFNQLSGQMAARNAQLLAQQRTLAEQQAKLAEQEQRAAEQAQQINQQEQMLAILADPGANAISLNPLEPAPNAQAKLQFNPTGNTAILSLNGLPELQASQQYQLWLFDSTGTPLPSTTFDATAKNVVINSGANFGGYVNFAISIEPQGGSPAPTGPIAMIANS